MKLRYRKPKIFDQFTEVVAAESLRHGGVSTVPFSSLNLSYGTDDMDNNIDNNRTLFFKDLNISVDQVAGSFQVHGSGIIKVTEAGFHRGYDALITNQINVCLNITIADCTPILIYDPVQKVVAAAHAGWRGTVGKIGRKTLQMMASDYNVNPVDCYAYIGTCISSESFEVDADVADHFEDSFKVWDESRGKFLVDLKSHNKKQLTDLGLPETQIEVSSYCTVKDNDDYFSHRKEKGKTGRSLAVIMMR
ncbi:MAG: peptidoglycan editing factor PgeF [Bacteroidota bacterium]